jgi:hypothetical protein
MNILSRLRSQPRWRLITAGAVVIVLVGGLVTVALLPTQGEQPTAASNTPDATPTATPTPEPVALPTADVAASFDGWTLENEADAASTFAAEAGDPADGSIALGLESTNPAENSTRRALSQVVAVTPSTEYTFTASIKNTSETKSAPGVAVTMGTGSTTRFEFASATSSWAEQSWTYETAADETSMPVTILSSGPTSQTRIDDATLTAEGTDVNLLANGSFEAFSAANPQITNTSLILATGDATIGVSWRIPSASWTLTDETGTTVEEGILDLQPGLGVVSLQDLDAGYYSIDLTNSGDANDHLQTSLAILDPVDEGAPTSDDRFGVGIHFTPAYLNSGPVAAALGISMARSDVKWNQVENVVNQYDFPVDLDTEVKNFVDAGVDFFPLSVYSNKFYDRGRTPSTPEGLQAFANFTSEVVGHYQSPAVEVYNEFNNPPMNKGACGITPECYLPLLKSTAETVKAAHPDTLIVGPATARHDDAWLTGLYAAGGLEYLDAVSFHPYDYSPESGPEFLEASLELATNRIKEYNNGEAKPIWITELGWSTTGYSEADQADNLVRAETISLANGVEKFFWYDLVNDKPDPAEHEGNFGLVRQTTATVPAFAPKPSGVAQAVLIRAVAGKPFTARDATANGAVYSYAFGDTADQTRVAWATSPTEVSYAASGDVQVTDQFGSVTTLKAVDGRVTARLDGHPQYLNGPLGDLQIAE